MLGGFATFHAPDTKQAVAQIHTKAEKTEQRIAAIDRKRVEDLAARRDVTALDRERAQLVDRRQELEMASMALGGGATSAEAHGGGHEPQVITGWKALDEKIDHAIRDPDFLIFKMEANGYKFSWALILLSMPFMGLIFLWKRGVAMFDHAVFVTYSLSFVSLLMVVMILWVKLAHLPGEALWLLAFPAHLFLQLRGAYGLGPLLGLLMTLAVTVMAGAVLLIWITGLLALGMAH